jgi:hypothetical protein
MAISRAQLLKELLPGLNALFGLEYARHTAKSTRRFTKPKLLSVHLKKKPSCLVSLLPPLKTKVPQFLMTTHKRLSPLGTHTKPLLLVFP